ncbi:MAG: NAD(P)/FAD-dependent oxidoreductase [Nitrosopumilus sp. H13]|nr:MAG: NAD(P)/FAD-dependent oxidoreductase [Nitrosopumilus sp. H13]
MYDVVIVGGGPAGSSAAMTAARGGASVIVLEKEASIAETVRTSGVTWIQNIKEFGIPEDCYNPVRNFGFVSPNNEVVIQDEEPRAAVLDVRKTYRWLARQAQDAGAEIRTGTNVTGVIKNDDGSIAGVRAGSEEFRSTMVIDASGFASVVCREMGIAGQWEHFGAGAEYEAEADTVDPGTWWLMVGEMYSPAGYAWIFPLGGNMVRIGVGVGKPESDADPRQILDSLMESRAGPIKKLGKITTKEFHYGLIPNDGLTRRTVFDNLMLVGDSAGQANPLVLEGIRYAIRFGRDAGRVAAGAIKAGRTDRDSLYKYEKDWRSQIESKINSARRIQSRWMSLSDKEWDRELDIICELEPDEFLDFIRADFGIGRMVKLAVHHPKIAVRQLFRLVR